MMHDARPKVGIFGLTSCAGDQLQILNCEDELLRLAGRIDIVDWVMAKSGNDHTCRLDIAFVEGVVATERDLETLRQVRARTSFLVALGTCAVWGGLPAMRNDLPRKVLEREVYSGAVDFLDTVEARPATDFVPVEYRLPGCPIERHEFLHLVDSLLAGTVPELPAVPVCACTVALDVADDSRFHRESGRLFPQRRLAGLAPKRSASSFGQGPTMESRS